MNQKGFVNIIIIMFIVILAGVGTYFALNQQATPPIPIPTPAPLSPLPSPTPTPSPVPIPIACTQEAKQCPDGSYVSRTGQNCEFAKCPGINLTPTPAPTPSPTPIPKPITSLSSTELKYRLENKFGKATFCGPPVVYSGYENELLKQFSTVAANTEEFSVILKHTNIANDGSWTGQEKLTIVNEYNRLSAISLEPSNGKYKFSIRSRSQDKSEFIYEGFIAQSGGITTTKQEDYPYGCPICLAGNTLIDTPLGFVLLKDLEVGMPIWTNDKTGYRVSGVVQKTSKVAVSPTHQMVHLVLDDGRELFVSPGHPTIDERTVGNLTAGDKYDGASIVSAVRVPYGESATYDVLPSGKTGFYWANGILLDSTLH